MRIIRTGYVFLAVILIFNISLLSGCSKSGSSQGKGNVIKIGVAQALSGPISNYGDSVRKGITLAVKQINEREYIGAGKKIEIIVEDTGGDPGQAEDVFKKLITRNKVAAIIGPTSSASAFAADPLAQEAGIPVIGSSTVLTGITDIGDYVFRTCLPDNVIISNMISKLVEKRGMSRVSVMFGANDQFTKNAYYLFSAALDAEKVTILTAEPFARGDTDFSSQLKKIKALNPQAIIISGMAEEAARIMIQARELGINDAYFVGGNSFYTGRLTAIAGKAAEGALCGVAWFLLNPLPANKEFIKEFGSLFFVDPDQFSAQAYTAVWVLAEAIRNAGSFKSQAIRDQLTLIKNYPTPLGNFSFDVNREPRYEPVIIMIKNTVFSLFDE